MDLACIAPVTYSTPNGPIFGRCKQCLPCRIYKQSSLTLRCLLENHSALSGQFLTLTYKSAPAIGDYKDFQTFLKRYRALNRREGNPSSIRYLACGEYGTQSGRFHYHALIWNGLTFPDAVWQNRLWSQGFRYIGTVTPSSIRYTARYTLKFRDRSEAEIDGWSRSPPLGSVSMQSLGAKYRAEGHALPSPPTYLSMEGKTYPVDSAMQIAFAEGYQPDWVIRDARGTRKLAKSFVDALRSYREVKLFGDPLEGLRRKSEKKSAFWERIAVSNGKV